MIEPLDDEINEMATWLGDPRNAEPCATFPLDPVRVSAPGMYAWHGDRAANELVLETLGQSRTEPLYAGQAGAASAIAAIESGATLKSRVIGQHLRGNTRASTFRRTLGALLWDELRLTRTRPRTLDAASNARLTAWMLEHMSVATAPVLDGSRLGKIEDGILRQLDPPLNLMKVRSTPGRRTLRALRTLHMGVADDSGSA
jgi:hypothetical protein